jgi:hypothetical protein
MFLQTHATSYSFYSSAAVHCEGERRKLDRKTLVQEIQTKVIRVFILAITSHLYSFGLRFLFLKTRATSYSFYSSVTVHCEGEKRENLIEKHTPFLLV